MSSIRFLTRTVFGVMDYAAASATSPTGKRGFSATGPTMVLVLLGALILTGCGSTPSLEQLEEQAFLSGDWSAVEQREILIARRIAIREPHCPTGMVDFCEKRGAQKRCECVGKAKMWELLPWL